MMQRGIVEGEGENINRVQKKNNNDKGIELQVHGSLIQDKHQIASVFNTFFLID